MDSNHTKQILIAHHAIESALEAMLKPVTTELDDAESVAKMPGVQYDTLQHITIDCAAIQKVLSRMADYLGDMEESIYKDGEIEEAGDMITDILFDVQPVPNNLANHMAAEAVGAARRTGRALY